MDGIPSSKQNWNELYIIFLLWLIHNPGEDQITAEKPRRTPTAEPQ